jgi:undecaprenyl-diphosphatase
MNLDSLIFSKINDLAGKSVCFDSFAIFCADYLGYVLIFILILFLLKDYKKYWQFVLKALVAAVLSRFVITELIRFFWEKPRPFIENNVNLLIGHEASSSFPSGHAAFYFALSTVVYFYNKKLGILFLISSVLISLSRVFVGVHWPSDILAGAIVGIFSGWLIVKLSKRFFLNKQQVTTNK